MTTQVKYYFIINFFKKYSIRYQIFDNINKLNLDILADMDFIVENNFKINLFLSYLVDNKCSIINLILNDYSYQVYFTHPSSRDIIHVDFMPGCSLRGIKLENNKNGFIEILYNKEQIHFTKIEYIYYYEMLREIIFTNEISIKYFYSIKNYYKNYYQKIIIDNYGNKFNENIEKLLIKEKVNYNFHFHFIKYSILKHPEKLLDFIYHYYMLFNRYVNYPGIYAISDEEVVDNKITNELFTGIEYLTKPKNIFHKIKNTIKLLKFRGEIKLVISKNIEYSYIKPDITNKDVQFDENIKNFLTKRIENKYAKYFN